MTRRAFSLDRQGAFSTLVRFCLLTLVMFCTATEGAQQTEHIGNPRLRDSSGADTQIQSSSAAAQNAVQDYMRQAEEAFDAADIVGAIALYRKAADLGDPVAQTRLGYLLDHAEQNREAAEWLGKAAAQNHAEAEFYLARMYSAPGELQQDIDRAVDLFHRAARSGYAPAIQVLVVAYETGDLQLVRSYDEAVEWLRAGVAVGDSWSTERLARAYRVGDLGLRIDTERSAELEAMIPQQQTLSE